MAKLMQPQLGADRAASLAPEPSAPLVLALDAEPVTLAKVSGNGVSLARMARAGFPVPTGFLITTDAYRVFVARNSLQAAIVALARDSARPREKNSADIQGPFERATMPPDVVREIQRIHTTLTQAADGTLPLAARSSPTAEDLPGASFAGQHDSFLHVRGRRRCSLTSSTAGRICGPRAPLTIVRGKALIRRPFGWRSISVNVVSESGESLVNVSMLRFKSPDVHVKPNFATAVALQSQWQRP